MGEIRKPNYQIKHTKKVTTMVIQDVENIYRETREIRNEEDRIIHAKCDAQDMCRDAKKKLKEFRRLARACRLAGDKLFSCGPNPEIIFRKNFTITHNENKTCVAIVGGDGPVPYGFSVVYRGDISIRIPYLQRKLKEAGDDAHRWALYYDRFVRAARQVVSVMCLALGEVVCERSYKESGRGLIPHSPLRDGVRDPSL